MIALLKISNLYAPECFNPTKEIVDKDKFEIATAMGARIKDFLFKNYPEVKVEVVSVSGDIMKPKNVNGNG